MQQHATNDEKKIYQFPQQKVLCDEKPFSRNLLHSLLKMVYAVSPPYTGYLKIEGDAPFLLFLFFFNGAPYAAGRYTANKPISFSIQEFGDQLAKSSEGSMTITLCETDPVLLKCMLLFLQEEPTVKSPVSLIDFEHIVRQISEAGTNAMIALCRDNKFNFFFFRDGKGALAHYADLTFKRPEGMTFDEELLLYAFQPGEDVQAFIFRDMVTTMAADSNLLSKDSLDVLFSVGYPKNRRSRNVEMPAFPVGNQKNRRKSDRGLAPLPAIAGLDVLVSALLQKPVPSSYIISVESGPLKRERFTVTLPCTIGRKGCDLILNNSLISRRHAELKLVENTLVIEDLLSTNGTRVNGETITRKQLIPNDLISIGPIDLRIIPL
ncbi:MAG: FHA domain-containing protein [Desulfuromonadaceae bacterium]|nr:FHA domain-containing protein [Desulfuromonadaceae bacterium]